MSLQALTQIRAIDIGGITVEIESTNADILRWLEFDFGTFLTTSGGKKPDVKLTVTIDSATEFRMPPLKETMRGPHFVSFDDKLTRYIKYGKEALLIYNYQNDEGQIVAEDEDCAYEHLYLTILSRIGEKLDLKGIHRVHALALACQGRAHLFLMPPGTGKSTLAFSLLQSHDDITLLSDDTPLIDHKGEVIPFLFRLGIENNRMIENIPSDFKREAHYGNKTKTLVNVAFFKEQFQKAKTKPKTIFVGFWTTSEHPQLVPVNKLTMLAYLFRDCVVGLGVPQVAEIFLRKEDVHKKAGIAFSRLRAILAVAGHCKCYKVYLSIDPKKNAELVLPILRN